MKIVLLEKMADGQLRQISERPWDENLISALQAANYVFIDRKEYEMIEGRINLDEDVFELLLIGVGGQRGGSGH